MVSELDSPFTRHFRLEYSQVPISVSSIDKKVFPFANSCKSTLAQACLFTSEACELAYGATRLILL